MAGRMVIFQAITEEHVKEYLMENGLSCDDKTVNEIMDDLENCIDDEGMADFIELTIEESVERLDIG